MQNKNFINTIKTNEDLKMEKVFNLIVKNLKEGKEFTITEKMCDYLNIDFNELHKHKDLSNKLIQNGIFVQSWCSIPGHSYICYASSKKMIRNRIDKLSKMELISYCCKSQEYLKKIMSCKLIEEYGEENVVSIEAYIVAKGNVPITLVAHLDTVHDRLTTLKEITVNGDIISSSYGIGGDDRCGVYIISKLAERNNKPNIILTTDEEIGRIGAKVLCGTNDIELVRNSKYIIELDRRGNNDAVFYDCDNQDFIDYIIDEFRFEFARGSYSDISNIAPKLNIAAVNLSSGYYNAHTIEEYINFQDVKDIYKRVSEMIDNLPNKYFRYY